MHFSALCAGHVYLLGGLIGSLGCSVPCDYLGWLPEWLVWVWFYNNQLTVIKLLLTCKGWLPLLWVIATMFYFENKDLEIKEVKKGLMHHMKEVTALQKQMTAMVNIVEGRVAQIPIKLTLGCREFWFQFSNFLVRYSVYIDCPSVLSWSNLKLHQTLEVKNIFKQEKIMPQLSNNPALVLEV